MQKEPLSKLWLLNVPLQLDYTHTILFKNKTQQQQYFLKNEHIVKSFDDSNLTYVRENNSIVVEGNRDELLNVNYIVYINPNFANKYYYCFVNSIDYISVNSSRLNISTDVFQTYIFDVELKTGLVDRYIPSKEDDLVGAFTYPENLELGEPQISSIDTNTSYSFMQPVFVLAVNGYWNGSSWIAQTPKGCTINGLPQAISYIFSGRAQNIRDWIEALNNAGLGDRIVSFFSVPAIAFNNLNGKHWALWVSDNNVMISDESPNIWTQPDYIKLQRPTKFHDNMTGDDFVPKNKKLFTYPFSYLVNSPQGGQPKIYRYEDFVFAESTTEISFRINSEITPNAKLQFIPQDYKIESNSNFNESNISSDYPTLAYVTDVFNAWLMKNQNILDMQQNQRDNIYNLDSQYNQQQAILGQLSLGLNAVSSGVTSAIAGNYGGAVSGLANYGIQAESQHLDYEHTRQKNALNYSYESQMQLAQISKESLTPGGITDGSNSLAIYNAYNTQQVFCHYSIKTEYAKRIDEFFNRFGYRINQFMNINDCINTRSNWNFIKTTNIIITGNITQDNMEILKSIFNNGVTLWHSPDTFLDFSQDNN